MERRPPKDDDQENVEHAFLLIKGLMAKYSNIEPSLWAAAVWSVLVDEYINSGLNYEEFCSDLNEIKNHYKDWFEDEQ